MVELTVEKVQRTTGATRANAELFLPFIQGTCKAYDINTPLRVTGFLSQMGHESQGFAKLEEGLNYSVEALLEKFGRHRISEADARKYGYIKGVQKSNPEMIANLIYGGEWGKLHLGNLVFGDGWAHRGMGAKQLTGLDNHNRCGKAIGEDFVNHPERLLMPVNAILSGGWFWATNGLSELADKADVRRLTKEVNGGYEGFDNRLVLWNNGIQVFA